MPSLKDKFEELRLKLNNGRGIDGAGSDPIFYLVFPTSEILEVKRQTKAWIAKLSHDNWNVVSLSMADAVESVIKNHRLRSSYLQGEKFLLNQAEAKRTPIDFREINKTLAKALSQGPELQQLIEEKLEQAKSQPHGLLLLTDLEALHPYLRINTIEGKLHGRTHCPVVVLYPGKREGRTSLRFLEFYPPDPNYRSEHIG